MQKTTSKLRPEERSVHVMPPVRRDRKNCSIVEAEKNLHVHPHEHPHEHHAESGITELSKESIATYVDGYTYYHVITLYIY